jgi:hypothetical protein
MSVRVLSLSKRHTTWRIKAVVGLTGGGREHFARLRIEGASVDFEVKTAIANRRSLVAVFLCRSSLAKKPVKPSAVERLAASPGKPFIRASYIHDFSQTFFDSLGSLW